MKKNRVDCEDCIEFIPMTFVDPSNLLSKINAKAKCKLGKRVMFRIPTNSLYNECGWFRYCNKYLPKQ